MICVNTRGLKNGCPGQIQDSLKGGGVQVLGGNVPEPKGLWTLAANFQIVNYRNFFRKV